jgi:hypothetical protein
MPLLYLTESLDKPPGESKLVVAKSTSPSPSKSPLHIFVGFGSTEIAGRLEKTPLPLFVEITTFDPKVATSIYPSPLKSANVEYLAPFPIATFE